AARARRADRRARGLVVSSRRRQRGPRAAGRTGRRLRVCGHHALGPEPQGVDGVRARALRYGLRTPAQSARRLLERAVVAAPERLAAGPRPERRARVATSDERSALPLPRATARDLRIQLSEQRRLTGSGL